MSPRGRRLAAAAAVAAVLGLGLASCRGARKPKAPPRPLAGARVAIFMALLPGGQGVRLLERPAVPGGRSTPAVYALEPGLSLRGVAAGDVVDFTVAVRPGRTVVTSLRKR